MKTAIDRFGRVVIPKRLRAAVGLENGGEVEIEVRHGRIEIEPASVSKRLVERDGRLVIEADGEVPPVTTGEVRALLEKLRR